MARSKKKAPLVQTGIPKEPVQSGKLTENHEKAKVHDAFFSAIATCNITDANHILFSASIDPSFVNAAGCNILHVAARASRGPKVDKHGVARAQNTAARDSMLIAMLKHKHAPDLYHEDTGRWTPLAAAIRHNNAPFVKLLLEHTDVDIDRRDSPGSCPWLRATVGQSWDIVVHMLTLRGHKPLTLEQDCIVRDAAKADRRDVIHALIDSCLYSNQSSERRQATSGDTVLMEVVRAGANRAIVRGVLGVCGPADIHAVNSANETALSLAVTALPRYLCEGYSVAAEVRAVTLDDEDGHYFEDDDFSQYDDDPEAACAARGSSIQERCFVLQMLLTASPRPDINFRHEDGNSALLLAATQGLPNLVLALLNASPPADVTAVNNAGETVLMLMLSASYDVNHINGTELNAVMDRIISASRGAINAQDSWGQTALHRAMTTDISWDDPTQGGASFCRVGRGFVAQLLQAGADPDIIDIDGDTPLMVYLQCGVSGRSLAYNEAAEDADWSLGWSSPLSSWEYTADTWLETVVTAQQGRLCEQNAQGRCAVSLAAEFWPDMLPRLLQATRLAATQDVLKLINLAASTGCHTGVASLLKAGGGLDVNARDAHGRTALHFAVAGSIHHLLSSRNRLVVDKTLVRMLLDAGADVNVADASGRTPLMLASFCDVACMQDALLAAQPRPDVVAADIDGRTALHYLFAERSFEPYHLHEFENHYRDPLQARPVDDAEGQVSTPEPARIAQLLEVGGSALANAVDTRGRSALLLAVSRQCLTGCQKEAGECFRAMLQNGCDVNVADHDGRTAVMAAAARQSPLVLHVLLTAATKPDLTRQDSRGNTALLRAVKARSVACAEALLAAGNAAAEARNEVGNTALLVAVRNGSDELVAVLLRSKPPADPEVTDAKGRSALMLALGYGQGGIAAMLLQAGAMSSLRALAERQVYPKQR